MALGFETVSQPFQGSADLQNLLVFIGARLCVSYFSSIATTRVQSPARSWCTTWLWKFAAAIIKQSSSRLATQFPRKSKRPERMEFWSSGSRPEQSKEPTTLHARREKLVYPECCGTQRRISCAKILAT